VVSNVTFDVAEVVKAQTGALTTLVPTISVVLDRLRKELIEPVFNSQKKDTQTQTPTQPAPRTDIDPLRHEPGGVYRPNYQPGFEDPLRSIGRRDLDPLAQGGGGMIVSFGRFSWKFEIMNKIFSSTLRCRSTRPALGFPGCLEDCPRVLVSIRSGHQILTAFIAIPVQGQTIFGHQGLTTTCSCKHGSKFLQNLVCYGKFALTLKD
jgi:hypothetical protein